jgi:predicted RNase H-like nuclease
LAVRINESGTWGVEIYTDIAELWAGCQDASLILIDIPIGLKEQGREERRCDKIARNLLGPDRGRCVFPAPCRPALSGRTFTEAGDINERMTGRRLSQQTWAILPKIKQIDSFLLNNPTAHGRIREVHPEVCFWALARQRAMQYAKTKKIGFEERYGVLVSFYPPTEQVLYQVLSGYPRKQVKKDDVLDALVAAVTAWLGNNNLSSIPEKYEKDARKLAMEMVYFLPEQAGF